jgi:hypothetical protein
MVHAGTGHCGAIPAVLDRLYHDSIPGHNRNDHGTRVRRPGGAALSERQREMVSMVEAYGAAWQATDGDGVASFMTTDGYIEYRHDNTIYRVSDGTLQERVTNGPYDTLQTVAPMTVYDNWIVLSGRIDSMSLNWLSVVRFTSSGDVKIMSETIFL